MSFPPHLPPPSSNINQHRQWERLKLILAAAFFGLAAGLSGAAMLLGWIWSGWAEGDTWVTTQSVAQANRRQVEQQVRENVAERLFVVYRKANTVQGISYFAPADKLVEATMAVSNGWMVAYLPTYDNSFDTWRIVGPGGKVYRVEKVFPDAWTGIVYIKITSLDKNASSAEQFKVVTFNEQADRLNDLFAFHEESWFPTFALPKRFSASDAEHLDSAAVQVYPLGNSLPAGSFVFDSQGRVVGVVAANNALLPATYLVRFLSGIEERKQILYPSLGVEGWFGDERPIVVNGRRTEGFLVTKVMTKNNLLRRGDILLEINGQIVKADLLWYTNTNQLRVKLLRDGKEIEMTVERVEL